MNIDEESLKGALSVPCPRCGAVPGVPCRTERMHNKIKYPHLDRVNLGSPRKVVER